VKSVDKPQVTSTDRIFDGKMIGVRVDALRWAGGASQTREVVEYGEAVVIVPVDDDGRLLMVRQYRHAVGQWLLELPAGGIDDADATPEAAALRELREETGYRGALTRVGGMFLAPGYSDEHQHVFVARDLTEDPLQPDDDEDLLLERLTLEDALALVASEQIRDAKTLAALLMYLRGIARP